MNRAKVGLGAVVWVLALLALPVLAGTTEKGQNELLNESGLIRRIYVELDRAYPQRFLSPDDRTVRAMMNHPLDDNIRIVPTPLILTDRDHQLLLRGAEQRARALRAFFADLMIGQQKIFQDGMMPGMTAEALFHVSGMNLEYYRLMWKNRSESDIRFFSGSDIVRNEDGNFVVMEDNVGAIGGWGDIRAMRSALFQGLTDQKMRADFPGFFGAFQNFLDEIGFHPGADGRDTSILVDTPRPVASPQDHFTIFPQDEERLRTRAAIATKEMVRVLNRDEFATAAEKDAFRAIFSLYSLRWGLAQFPDLVNRLHQRFADGDLKLVPGPGTELLSSKALLPYVETFITYYLNEEPLIRSHPTRILTPEMIESLTSQHVVKANYGSSGNHVYVLRDLSEQSITNFKAQIVREFEEQGMRTNDFRLPIYVVQDYLHSSYLPVVPPDSWLRLNLDMRPLVFVGGQDHYTADLIFGRASFRLPGILNNMAKGAFGLVVLRESECEDILRDNGMTPR